MDIKKVTAKLKVPLSRRRSKKNPNNHEKCKKIDRQLQPTAMPNARASRGKKYIESGKILKSDKIRTVSIMKCERMQWYIVRIDKTRIIMFDRRNCISKKLLYS